MRINSRRNIWLTAAVTAALVGGGLAPASATARPDKKLHSFAGSCSVQGTVTFKPPLTNTQQPLSFSDDSSGTCSGTLDGRNVSNAPVKYHSTGHADGSCLQARTSEPAEGAMTFADGTTIRFTFEFTFVLTEGEITFYGKRSGSALGHGSFLTARTPPDAASKCAGEGNAELPMDLTLTTVSPLVG
jgi:hypothetical protein